MVSLCGWLKEAGKESPLLLPSPADPCTSAANDSVQQVSKEKRRKRGRYHHYDAEVRAKIAKHACQHGNKSAALRFTQKFGHCVSQSSVMASECNTAHCVVAGNTNFSGR